MEKTRIADGSSVESKKSPPPNQNSENNGGDKLELSKEEKEWDEAICPVCMEHPHNPVLLICSSHKLGCRHYMCKTTRDLSDCFDKFCESYGSRCPLKDAEIKNHKSIDTWIDEASRDINPQQKINARCPFCRGVLYGYVIIESARQFMNSRPRICSNHYNDEMCDFKGSYAELRDHCRSRHVFIPSSPRVDTLPVDLVILRLRAVLERLERLRRMHRLEILEEEEDEDEEEEEEEDEEEFYLINLFEEQ